jgi:hypothetical protein
VEKVQEEKLAEQKAKEDEEAFTSVRKEKLREIQGAKELFEKRSKIKWSETYDNALKNVQKMYPKKSLYDAMRSRVNEFASKLNNKELYNPTSEDIAVFNVFRAETEKRIDAVEGLDSDDSIKRDLAIAELENYNADLFNIARVTNPDGEAGRAFKMLQSTVNTDSGLKIRQMQLTRANGGEKLSPELESWVKDRWEEEKAVMRQENEALVKKMEETFDNKISELQKKYDEKVGKSGSGKEKTLTEQKRKSVADSLRKAANDFENFSRVKGPDGKDIQRQGIDVQKMIADAMRYVADKIEEGKLKLPEIIATAISKYGKENEDELRNSIRKQLIDAGIDESDFNNKPSVLKRIEDFAEENNVTDITNEMVAKNLIRDYVNSHIGQVNQEDILDTAFKDLKTVLPNTTKANLIEAYLKENAYKQPSKEDLEGGLKESQKQLTNIAKLTEDIEDLNNMKNVRKRGVVTVREKSDYEKELLDEKNAKLKSLNEERRRVEKEEKDLQKREDKLAELDANIQRAKNNLDIIKEHKNKNERQLDEEIASKERELKRAIKDNSSEDRVQAKKLEEAKETARQKIKEYQQKIADGDFSEPEPVTLKKQDAELINLKKQQSIIEDQYRKKQHELEEKNKSKLERGADFLRSAYVTTLIWKLGTLAKVATMSALRPISEGTRKLTLGKVFNTFFPNISVAGRGSWRGSRGSIQCFCSGRRRRLCRCSWPA